MGRSDGLAEDGWLRAKNPGLMLDYARKSTSHRRVRLATVGICRAAWPFMPPSPQRQDADCLALLDLSERYADGAVKQTELMAARRSLAGPDVPRGGPENRKVAAVWFASAKNPAKTCTEAAFRLLGVSWGGTNELDLPAEYLRDGYRGSGDWVAACLGMVAVIRDIFGNPLRPVAFDPRWGTSTVTTLASQMYESRDIGAMPILADALQDAGCDNTDILDHCRGDGPHVRGCWVVDLVLGKE
jgi:hypothetical protein